jgi:anthranilate synthase component 1
MRYSPTFDEFVGLAREHTMVPIYRQLIGDTLTPVSAFCKIQEGDWAFLFESVVGGERVGRYSFVGAGPFLRYLSWGPRVQVTAENRTQELEHDDPVLLLQEHLARYRAPALPGLPRFCGGAVGYAAYDSVRYTERLPNPPYDDRQLPDLCFAFFDRMVIFDHINKTIAVVAHAQVPMGSSKNRDVELQWSYKEACRRVDQLVERLQQGVADLQLTDIQAQAHGMQAHGMQSLGLEWKSNFSRGAFESAVRKCQEYIKAGDIFQVVLSQRLQTETKARPFDIYRALRVINPSPFMFYVRCGNHTLVGSSPEVMVRVEGNRVITRPLAGTRPRGATEEADQRLAAELLADPKERAEHIMLVDLGRNDIGRVSRYGTVELNDVMVIERYSHVMHISSNVAGQLQERKTALDALRACLPAGTLSGAPKVRAMEIIDELEPHQRGPYGGAVGYVDFSGNMDTCIALRTLVLKGQTAYLQAGAGIVADSVPGQEYDETISKAMGLLRAIEIAETQL